VVTDKKGNYIHDLTQQDFRVYEIILLRALADGTSGFTVLNTNDLLGGLNRIARELNEFYVLGYVPPSSKEGSCHTLKVKLARGGVEIRSRSGYCNTRPVDPLEGKPLEKQLEAETAGAREGSIKGSMQVLSFLQQS
jgi:hypothetical protein